VDFSVERRLKVECYRAESKALPTQRQDDGKLGKPSITVDEANAVAMKLAKQNPQFVHGRVRDWAAAIRKDSGKTCSTATVKKMPFWIRTMEITSRGRTKGKTPKAVGITDKLKSGIGTGSEHEVLEALIAEQAGDLRSQRNGRLYKQV
jgi:hypothetical protein